MPSTFDDNPGSDPLRPEDGSATARYREALYPSLEQPGDEIGPYTLVAVIGSGGFGTVWKAVRRHPFAQTVALKFLHSGSRDVIARFEQERQILASLNHPGIAQVHEGGMTPAGRPYFAMEFVEGLPITRYCDEKKLTIPERLRLFVELCQAVQHAHTAGVIHRDLKPGNVLVARGEGDRLHVKVIDFGVAKAMSGTMSRGVLDTIAGSPIGTPEYMSPEQASRDAMRIDFRTDVYSLGVMLYELLVGALPFEPAELRDRAEDDMKRIIREQDPPSPSARLSTVRADQRRIEYIERARGLRVEDLARELRSELEWIPLMAMRKERERRYERPIDLSRDIENYLEERPLVAAPESRIYLARKWVRRNQALVTGAGAVALALAVGLAVALKQGGEIIRQRAEIERRERDAEELRLRALEAQGMAESSNLVAAERLKEADGARSAARSAELAAKAEREIADRAAEVAREEERRARAAVAEADRSRKEAADMLQLLAREQQESARLRDRAAGLSDFIAVTRMLEAAQRGEIAQARLEMDALGQAGSSPGFPAGLASAMIDQSSGEPLRGHASGVVSVAVSREGIIASGGRDRKVVLWDPVTGEQIRSPLDGHGLGISGLAFSDDGRMLATASYDSTIRVWDVGTSRPTGAPMRGHDQYVQAVSFHPDGKILASGGSDRTIRLWDIQSGRQLGAPITGHQNAVKGVAFSHDGKLLASASLDSTVRLWDVATRKPVGTPLRRHAIGVLSVAFSPDGKVLASGGDDQNIVVWDVGTGTAIGSPLVGHAGAVHCVSFDSAGALLASASEDGSIRLWDAKTRSPAGPPLRGHEREVNSVAFSRDGETLVSGSEDRTVRMWPVVRGTPADGSILGHRGAIDAIAFSHDGSILASAGADRTVRRWDVLSGRMLGAPLRGHEGRVSSLAFRPDGAVLASAGSDLGEATIRLWDAATGRPLGAPMTGHRVRGASGVHCIAFSSDGSMLASGGADRTVRLWDARTGASVGKPLVRGEGDATSHPQDVTSIAWSGDGRLLASGDGSRLEEGPLGRDGVVRLWDARTGGFLAELSHPGNGSVQCLAFSLDGRTLAAGGSRGIRLWDVESRRLHEDSPQASDDFVRCLAYGSDDRTLTYGCADGSVRLWHTEAARSIGLPMPTHVGGVFAVAFDPQARVLASAGADATIRLRHATPIGERIGAIRQRLAQIDRSRADLAREAGWAGGDDAGLEGLQERLLSDERFRGPMMVPMLAAIGERSMQNEEARSTRVLRINGAIERGNWAQALSLVRLAPPEDLTQAPAQVWNQLAWFGLTGLPRTSPEFDLDRFLGYAERAAELSGRRDGMVLDTLARAHWELGDKPKAIAVQAEAIAAAEQQALSERILKSISEALERYRSERPPDPPAAGRGRR